MNISQLINDLIDNDNGYYLGNIIVVERNDKRLELVDGQQRMVSFFLILLCLYGEQNFKKNVKDLIQINNKVKLIIKPRSTQSEGNILDSIMDNFFGEGSVSNDEKKTQEYKVFGEIKKIIGNLTDKIQQKLLNNLKNAKIVEISFKNDEASAHSMFVNLNTKGRALNDLDILKSILFKYLTPNSQATDVYQENWHYMLERLEKEKDERDYIRFISVYLERKKPNKNKGYLRGILSKITCKSEAKKVFNLMTEKGKLIDVYNVVKKHDLEKIEVVPNNSEIINLWRMFSLTHFEQVDFIMIAIIYSSVKGDKHVFSRKNVEVIEKFLQLVLIYLIIEALNKKSPSTYANNFVEAALSIMGKQASLKSVLLKFISNNLMISKFNETEVKNALDLSQVFRHDYVEFLTD
ncbi:hypothetical protein PESHB4_16250 [Pediococcus ethanolidurans]